MADKDIKLEDKVTYKGEELTPQEFKDKFDIETKKKERNAESVARQKLEKKQEEEERRKAFVEAIIPQEEDKIKDDYGPGSEQQEAPVDMSMYQLNLPFDVQSGPDLQLNPVTISQTPEARLGGLMSLVGDQKIGLFKSGGLISRLMDDNNIANYKKSKKK